MVCQKKFVLKKGHVCKLTTLLTIVCAIFFFYIKIFIKVPLVPIVFNYTDPFKHPQHNTTQQVRKLKIVIPFQIKQVEKVLDNISKWKKFKPCDHNNSTNENIELIFYMSYLNADQDIVKKLSLISNESLECFADTQMVFYKYNSIGEDQHVTGSRLMFESMLNKSNEHFNHTDFVFYMEPDVRPIKSNWLNALINEIDNGKFWIKGSCFRGDLTQFMKNDLYVPNYFHINGNALYNIGSDDFRHFYFKVLRPYVVKKNGDSKNAYDTDFFEFFFDSSNYETTRDVIHQFHLSDFIQNLWKTKYIVDEFTKKYANTYFVHGGFPCY